MQMNTANINKLRILTDKINVLRNFVHKHGMSQYPKYYIEPIFEKTRLEGLEKSGEAQKLTHIPTRAALVDQTSSRFHDPVVKKFINYVMKDGRKELARDLVERTFLKIKLVQLEKYNKTMNPEIKQQMMLDPKEIFLKAVENCKPVLRLMPIKRGGITYQVPTSVNANKSQFLSMKWLLEATDAREDRKILFPDQMAYELIDAANNTGKVIKRKQDLHKLCEANRAYAHYRWG